MATIEDQLLVYGCFEDVENWAYQSKYEEEIWENNWQQRLRT